MTFSPSTTCFKRCAGLWLLVCWVPSAFGQLVEVPIRADGSDPAPRRSQAGARTTAVTPLRLPFFDDFSRPSQRVAGTMPDTARWVMGGGVNVNNTLPLNHPTAYVATFDGLNRRGVPYDFLTPTAQGPTDTLTSRPIDLSPYGPASGLYLSFFWEARGRAEQPDLGDSLALQFKDKDERWKTVWTQSGQRRTPSGAVENVSDTAFVQVLVPVNEAAYFHKNFQFQFRAYGRQSGAYDVWHLDYIYLAPNRTLAAPYNPEPYPPDLAVRGEVSPFLRRYTAMPVRQYFAKPETPALETAPTISLEFNNLDSNPRPVKASTRVEDTLSRRTFQNCDLELDASNPCGLFPETAGFKELRSEIRGFVPAQIPDDRGLTPLVIKTSFELKPTGDALPGVDLSTNDRMAGYTVLNNYYAYDDGTAEAGVGINQRVGSVAVRYIVNQPDTIVAVRMHMAQANVNLAGQTFILQIFGNKNGLPDGRPLYQKDTLIHYPKTLNGFVEYPVFPSVVVRDTFYVGWQQTTETLMPVGLDKNTDFPGKIFYSLGTREKGIRDWVADTDVKGSLMVRPVVGKFRDRVTGTEEEQPLPSSALRVYPNPTDGNLTWNDAEFNKARLYDLRGRLLLSQDLKGQPTPRLDLASLSNGMYLLHLSNGKRTVVKKVVLRK